MIASVRGRGERVDAHRGLRLAGETAQGGRRREPSLEDGRRLRRKTMQGPPCFGSPWIDSRRSCEDPTGVREVRGSPTAINFGRDRAHGQWRSWRNSTVRASWAWLGLRSRYREVTGEAAWCLRGGRDALVVRVADSAVKADRATDLRNPGFGGSASRR
jgi:hypothetical protein